MAWGAIIAGIVVTLVTQILLNMLGIGVGLSTVSLNAADNPDAGTFSLVAAAWWIAAGVIAAFVGGLVAGRLCGRPLRSTAGWHGLIAWAATTLIILWAVTASVGGLIGGAFSALGNVTAGAGAAAGGSATAMIQSNDPFSEIQQDVQRSTGVNDPKALSASVMNYLRSAASDDAAAAQAARQRAVDDLARASNITPEEANARLTNWENEYKQAAEKAKQAAEATRKVVAQASIYGFVALLLGALAGWFGGLAGTPTREITVVATRTTGAYVP